MVALTATLAADKRLTLQQTLFLHDPVFVTECIDRTNITYYCVKALSHKVALGWLLEQLKAEGEATAKVISYCRTIKHCALIYEYFFCELSDIMFAGHGPLVAMYHSSTPGRNKRFLEQNFTLSSSATRVIIATSAFGLGVDISDVQTVIHWQCPESQSVFLQQSGRAGRNGRPAYALTYHSATDTSTKSTDKHMQSFCRNEGSVCRRSVLLNASGGCGCSGGPRHVAGHKCCDICCASCECGSCPSFVWTLCEQQQCVVDDCGDVDMDCDI